MDSKDYCSCSFISTFRYNVGTDFFNYAEIYGHVNQIPLYSALTNFNYSNEPLFIILNRVAGLIFNDYKGMLFLSSFIVRFLITKMLMFFEKDISLIMGFFISYMFHLSTGLNVMRQMIAAAFVFYSFKYIYIIKLTLYLILVKYRL